MTTGHDQVLPDRYRIIVELVADLHHRRPDVVEELNLDHRLELARRHPDGAADDAGFGERRVEDAVVAERALQTVRELEDAALAGHDRQRFPSAGVARRPRRRRRCVASRAISSFSVRLSRPSIVSGLPSGLAGVSNAAEHGSTSGE